MRGPDATSASEDLFERVHGLALAVGFDVAGVAPAEPTPETEFLREWIARGYAGEMHYLERRVEERVDPRRVLEGARSIVVVGLVYDSGPRADAAPGAARVARYAGGDDYHDVMGERLRAFEAELEGLVPGTVRTRSFCDTGPVQERLFAATAGLGWIGKNTCLIHPRLGSYLFLGVVLTDLELAAGIREPDHCGTCRACLDACPTQAFPEPYVLDATRCISYATIEARGPIDDGLRAAQVDWVFGCDVCQEVCPWNLRRRREIPGDDWGLRARLRPRPEWAQPSLQWILDLTEETWRAATKGTALRLRNALVAAGNTGGARLIPSLRRHAKSSDPMIAEPARWALEQLERRADPRRP
ncbi:MAG: tRNA epoxyqueuosine(34) reductase QueG [Planctomycetota bacterium]|jgi:epoxyqueuosine reductase